MKRFFLSSLLLVAMLAVSAAAKPKYIFYFITDGTGVNTVLGAEMMRADHDSVIGRGRFCMTQFPVVGIASTFSANSGVTDSAASGTALATGHKTQNSALGMLPDLTTPVTSIAVWAKEAGMRVGVATSVTVNHATPAAFYAHSPNRRDYYNIATDMPKTGLDFYGGAAINVPDDPAGKGENAYALMRKAGYAIAYGPADYARKAKKARKILLVQDTTRLNPASRLISIPYALDRQEGEMSIEDVLSAELDFMLKDPSKGFLIMNEIGGLVDFACHAHDGAAAFEEVAAVDRCVKIAYDFYLKHPDETLIVVTADHETGGLTLGTDNLYELHAGLLRHQCVSLDAFTATLHALRKTTGNHVQWAQVKEALQRDFGFWGALTLSAEEEKQLQGVFHASFEAEEAEVQNEYSAAEPLADAARAILNHRARLAWTTGGHTAGLVPVYAVGPGSELFTGHNDNAEIPVKIASAAGILPPSLVHE